MRLQTHRGVARISCLVCLGLSLVLVSPARGAVIITLGAGVKNPPPPLTSIIPETAVADTAQLVPAADFNAILAATLSAQGYTAANNWVYSFTSPPLPAGLVNPVALPATEPNNARFNITTYELYLNPPKTAFGETFDFTLINPPADPVLAGAAITRHWLQLLNMDKRYGNFGYAIAGQPGFWQVDNGDVVGAAGGANRGAVGGAGPYYDSNAPGGGFSVPYSFHDSPHYYSGVGTYLHFTTIPAWDVSVGGQNHIIVGDTGISWGFKIVAVPEPSTNTIFVGIVVLILIVAPVQRTFVGSRAACSKVLIDHGMQQSPCACRGTV